MLLAAAALCSFSIPAISREADSATADTLRRWVDNRFTAYVADLAYQRRAEEYLASDRDVMQWLGDVKGRWPDNSTNSWMTYVTAGQGRAMQAGFFANVYIDQDFGDQRATSIIAFRGSLNPLEIFTNTEAKANWIENITQAVVGLISSDKAAEGFAAHPDDVISRFLPLYDTARRIPAIVLRDSRFARIATVGHSLGGGLAAFAAGSAAKRGAAVICWTFNTARLAGGLNEMVRGSGAERSIINFRVQGDGVSALFRPGTEPVGLDVMLDYVETPSRWHKIADVVAGFAATRHPMDAVFRGFAKAGTGITSSGVASNKDDGAPAIYERIIWFVMIAGTVVVIAAVGSRKTGIPFTLWIIAAIALAATWAFAPALFVALLFMMIMGWMLVRICFR